MNYATIKKNDVANGTGVRVSLFVSGCTHRCKGCFNSEAWDFRYGEPYTEAIEQEILDACAHSYIRGLSLLGGEPFEPQNASAILPLVKKFRERFPEKNVWCYSGYLFEQISSRNHQDSLELLKLLDVLVDGEFVEELKNANLRFKGSENQRILDVRKSLAEGKPVEHQF